MSNSNLFDLRGLDASDEEKDIRESHIGLNSTSTDMLAGMLANTDKLVSTDKRWMYGDEKDDDDYEKDKKKETEKEHVYSKDVDDRDQLDDDLDDYHKKEHKIEHNTENVDKERHESPKYNRRSETSHETVDTPTEKHDVSHEKDMSYEELMHAKLDMMRKLGELKQWGVTLTRNYSLNSNLKSMEYEYKLHSAIRSKQNGVKWMSHMLTGIVKGAEMLNDSYNPFEIKLAGLSNVINEDIQSYYDVLGEIYEKWNQPGTQYAPELKLLILISTGVMGLQLKKSLPSMIPEIAKNFKSKSQNIENLKKQASDASDKHRDALSIMAEKQHKDAEQRISDIEMIKRKDIEFAKMKKEAHNPRLRNDLILSTDSVGIFGNEEIPSEFKADEDINKLQIELLAKKQKIHDARTSIDKKATIKFLKAENKKLDGILDSISNVDDESHANDNATNASTESKISINPSIDKLINGKNKKSVMQKKKIKNKVNERSTQGKISLGSITLGSNEKKKNATQISLDN
jgi:hypothetical protein